MSKKMIFVLCVLFLVGCAPASVEEVRAVATSDPRSSSAGSQGRVFDPIVFFDAPSVPLLRQGNGFNIIPDVVPSADEYPWLVFADNADKQVWVGLGQDIDVEGNYISYYIHLPSTPNMYATVEIPPETQDRSNSLYVVTYNLFQSEGGCLKVLSIDHDGFIEILSLDESNVLVARLKSNSSYELEFAVVTVQKIEDVEK